MPNISPFDVKHYLSRTKADLERDLSMREPFSYDYGYMLGKLDLCNEILYLLKFYKED